MYREYTYMLYVGKVSVCEELRMPKVVIPDFFTSCEFN